MDIYYRYDLRKLCDSAGNEILNSAYQPKVACQSKIVMTWHFLEESAAGSITHRDMSGVSRIFWTLAVDKDWDSATVPMARATDAEINKTQASQGKLVISLNTNTTQFLSAVDKKESIPVKIQLKSLDGYAEKTDAFVINAIAQGDIDLSIDPPAEAVTNHYTKAESDAMRSEIYTDISYLQEDIDDIYPAVEADFLKKEDAEETYATKQEIEPLATKQEAEDSAFLWAVIMG